MQKRWRFEVELLRGSDLPQRTSIKTASRISRFTQRWTWRKLECSSSASVWSSIKSGIEASCTLSFHLCELQLQYSALASGNRRSWYCQSVRHHPSPRGRCPGLRIYVYKVPLACEVSPPSPSLYSSCSGWDSSTTRTGWKLSTGSWSNDWTWCDDLRFTWWALQLPTSNQVGSSSVADTRDSRTVIRYLTSEYEPPFLKVVAECSTLSTLLLVTHVWDWKIFAWAPVRDS